MAMNRCSTIYFTAFLLVTIGFSVNYANCRGDETPPATDVAITDDEAQSLLAYERFLQVLRQHPGNGTSLEHVYGFHLERGTVDEFLTSLVEAEARETDGSSITIRGLVELQRGHDEEAAEILRAAEQQRLNDPMVAWALARALNRTGELAESAKALERAIERNPERADLLAIFQDLNRAYRRSQQHEKAGDVWNRMERLFPNDLRVKEQIANSLYEDGDFESALPRFQELAKLSSDPYLATQASVFAAEIMLRLNQKDEALKSFESQLKQLDPESWLHRDIRQRIESVFIRSGDYSGLATYYESWLKTHPDDVDAMARLGRSLAYQGRLEDARNWYANALKRSPSNVGLREAMIEQLVREEEYAEAIGHHELLYKAGVATSDHIQEWGSLWLNRKEATKDHRQSRAAEVWMLLLRDKSDDAVAVSHVADLMRDADLTDRAMTLYQQAITLAPDQPKYKVDLGDLYHSLQQRDKALETWRAIASGDHRTTENLVRLANVLRNHGYRDEALQTMRDVVETSPEFHHHIRLAQMLRDTAASGDRARLQESLAQVNLASAIAESPEEHETVLQERIRGLQDLGRLQSVADELTLQLAANPDATASDYRTLALYRAALDDLPAATAAIETAIRADNPSVAVWKTAADLFEHAGRLSDAGDALRRLTDIDGRFRGEHLLKIISLERQLGQIQGALEAGNQLLETAPGNPDHLQTYADLCFQAGDIEEGLNTLRRAVRVNSSDEKSLLALAQALTDRNEFEEAMELYWTAFDRCSKLADRKAIIATLAELSLQINQLDRLIQTLELRSRDLSQRRDMVFCLAQVYRNVNDLTSCRAALERLASADSRDLELLAELGKLATESLDLEAAADYQRRINAIQPSDEGSLQLANLLTQLGDDIDAESIRMRVMESQSDPVELLQSVDRLSASGNLKVARDLCHRILQRDPENWEAILREGMLEWRQGNRDEAMMRFDSILAMKRDWNELSAVAAQRNASGGTLDPARRHLERVANASAMGVLLQSEIDGAEINTKFQSLFRHRSSQVKMPQDFGESRIVCQHARLLNTRDNALWQAQLLELQNESAKSLATALETFGVFTAAGIGIEEVEYQTRWIDLARALGQSESTDAAPTSDSTIDEAQLAMIDILLGIRRPTLRYSKETPGLKSSAPPLSAEDVESLISAFAHLTETHPQWFTTERIFGVVLECDLANESGRLRELAIRLTAANSAVEQRTLALQLLSQIKGTTIAELLDIVEQIEAQQPPQKIMTRQNQSPPDPLSLVGLMVLRTDDLAGYQRLLMALVSRAAARVQGSQLTGYDLARKLHQIWQQAEFRPYKRQGKTADNVPIPFEWRCLDSQEAALLRDLRSSLIAKNRDAELNAWCSAQKTTADADHALVLELMQASFAASDSNESTFELHLIHALELSNSDHELRGRLIAQCKRKQLYSDTIALLEQIPDDNLDVLKAREFEILSVALKAGNKDRAVTAAKRLYGFHLDDESRKTLSVALRQLDLLDMARDVEARTRVVTPPRKVSTPMELMEQYARKGKMDAAAQVAQQILRRRSGTRGLGLRGARSSGNDPHAIALQVLRDCGKLDAMIARQEEQLETSPDSVLLLENLQELYRAAGDYKSAVSISQRLVATRPENSTTELLQLAEDLRSLKDDGAACDVMLKLLREHPIPFLRSYIDWSSVLRQQGRIKYVAATIERMGANPFAADPGATCEFVVEAMKLDESRKMGVSLLARILRVSRDVNWDICRELYEPEMWTSPELFDLFAAQLIPTSEPGTEWMPVWSPVLKEDLFGHFERSEQIEPQGWLRLLQGILEIPGFHDKLQNRIHSAQEEFPTWHDGELLLAVLDYCGGNLQASHVRMTKIIEDSTWQVARDKAFTVAAILQRSDSKLRLDACRLLENVAALDSSTDIDFSRPDVVLLMRLYGLTEQQDKGRALILRQLTNAEPNLAADSHESATESRFSAMRCLIEMGAGLDALQALSAIDPEVAKEYSEDFNTLLGLAANSLTPDGLTQELQRQLHGSKEPNKSEGRAAQVDLRIVTATGELASSWCSSDTLASLDLPKQIDEAHRTVIQKLSDTLNRSLTSGNVDPSVVIVATYWILSSGDEASIAKITPALDRWLNRPIARMDAGVDAATLIRSAAVDIAYVDVARKIIDQPGLETLSERMMDRAIAIGRQLPDKKYLAALLYERATQLAEQSDQVSANELLQEMRDLNIPNPVEQMDSDASGSEDEPADLPADSSRAASIKPDITIDLGSELRKNLLKALP